MEHKISPVQLRLDKASREIGAQFGAPGVPRRKESKILFRETQRTFEHRFIPALRYKAQNIVLCEKGCTFEQRLQGKPEFQIVCRQDERECLAGRYELPVRVPDAAELGEFAIERFVFSMENIQ